MLQVIFGITSMHALSMHNQNIVFIYRLVKGLKQNVFITRIKEFWSLQENVISIIAEILL